MKNRFDSRNRNAKAIVADLGSERGRLVVVGSRKFRPGRLVEALRTQWSSVVDLVGFEPSRIITGDAEGGAEKAARILAKSVTGKLAAVFHRADVSFSPAAADVFLNILLSKTADAALILAMSGKPICMPLRRSMMEWGKKYYQVEVG